MTRRTILVVAISFANVAGAASILAEAQLKKQPSTAAPTTYLLNGLSELPAWAHELEERLRHYGQDIDRAKAKRDLLPRIVSVQKQLSDLEDVNLKLSNDLLKDDFQDDLRYSQSVEDDLEAMQAALRKVSSDLHTIRASVQLLALPELTNLERGAEGGTGGRSIIVENLLGQLRYERLHPSDSPEQAVRRKTEFFSRRERVTVLLHQAQDSFGTLHSYLER